MNGPYLTIAILMSTPLQILIIHAVMSRVMRDRPRQVVALRAAAAGSLPVGVLLCLSAAPGGTDADRAGTILYCCTVYVALAYTYFHFFNTSETARRVRLLYELDRAGTLSGEQISDLYKTASIIDLRLRRLVEMGQLGLRDGSYSIQGRTLYGAALIMAAWQKLLKLRK